MEAIDPSTTTTNPASPAQTICHLDRPEGRVAYEVSGNGPLVVLVPGMGDLRSAYRFLAPALQDAGYRVAATDLRGHGDSDTSFASYGDVETAGDIVALIEVLGGPAVVVGNSMGAGAAVYAAAERPALIDGLVLVGPFVRNGTTGAIGRTLLRVAMAPPWAAATWKSYLPKLYKGRLPVDFKEYRSSVVHSLRRPGYAKAFSRTTRTDHTAAEIQLSSVHAPTLVVMGELDPDFKDPYAEAEWISNVLRAEVVMVPEAGHYPQSQQPEVTTAAVLGFISEVTHSV
jgi:pimeloyl-ACP methyl ester carboxylesterase